MKSRLLTWLVIAFVIFYIVKSPARAASTANGLLSWLGVAAGAFGDFLSRVFA